MLGRARGAVLAAALAAGAAPWAAGCSQNCCTVESEPIPLTRAPRGDGAGSGALLALAQLPDDGAPFSMVIDTSSPVTILAGDAGSGKLTPQRRAFDLLDPTVTAPMAVPVRARFRDIGTFQFPVGATGDAATLPLGVFGADLLRSFAVELRFGAACPGADAGAPGACSSMTFWRHQGASLGFLEDAGYVVLRFTPFGGGETSAQTSPDAFGLRGPVTIPATRVVLRGCAAPRAFARDEVREACCTRGTEIERVTGADLALVLATGAGPVVLSRAAWNRVAATLTAPSPATSGSLLLPTWAMPIAAEWHTIPRLALVDGGEPPSSGDQGPCVDLGRSRRIEWVSAQQHAAMVASQQQGTPYTADCVQPCDTDPREPGLAQNSAAYLELGGAIPVAVIEDTEPYLQALRFDVRPEGPEVDGLVGAGALGPSRLELDYLDDPALAIFSCEPGTPRETCYAAPRCPRLPDHEQGHLCFGLPATRLPATCAPSGC